MKSFIVFCLLSFGSLASLHAQLLVGVEAQQYPTGYLLGVYGELAFAEQHSLNVRLGYNLLDHKGFGVQDDEQGGGFGGTFGYRYYFNPNQARLFLGVRADLWFNTIDWETAGDIGETDVTVLQPTAMVGYSIILGQNMRLTPTLAVGAEINVDTDGAEVGEGAIALWGLNLVFKL